MKRLSLDVQILRISYPNCTQDAIVGEFIATVGSEVPLPSKVSGHHVVHVCSLSCSCCWRLLTKRCAQTRRHAYMHAAKKVCVCVVQSFAYIYS